MGLKRWMDVRVQGSKNSEVGRKGQARVGFLFCGVEEQKWLLLWGALAGEASRSKQLETSKAGPARPSSEPEVLHECTDSRGLFHASSSLYP